MGNLRKNVIVSVGAVLFVSMLAGMIIYPEYLKTTNHLVATVRIFENGNNSMLMAMFPEFNRDYIYDCLWIKGSATNIGQETAFNAGLRVFAWTPMVL